MEIKSILSTFTYTQKDMLISSIRIHPTHNTICNNENMIFNFVFIKFSSNFYTHEFEEDNHWRPIKMCNTVIYNEFIITLAVFAVRYLHETSAHVYFGRWRKAVARLSWRAIVVFRFVFSLHSHSWWWNWRKSCCLEQIWSPIALFWRLALRGRSASG